MALVNHGSKLAVRVRDFVREGFSPHFGKLQSNFKSDDTWRELESLGTELWLDSGDIEDISGLWTREFTALTTNNTLLNREIQKGTYDDLIPQAARLLHDFPELDDRQRKLEMAFILNARHALRLVEKFDAFVSVEEHTDLADDLEGSVEYARRFHAICPERFYVKIPFSPAGLLATRRLSDEGISINHTLGFSARQNYIIARMGRPAFVNVFMGRLNSFVADNDLGEGAYVGERATLASQRAVRGLRDELGIETRQIGASFREGAQVRDVAGIDVMTVPCKVAREFLALGLDAGGIKDRTGEDYKPPLAAGVDPRRITLDTLWEVNDEVVACVKALEGERLQEITPGELVNFFVEHGCGDVLVDWTDEQVETSAEEGKIPKLENWEKLLAQREIALDSLMNLAGWNSFDGDQREMDRHVEEVLSKAPECF